MFTSFLGVLTLTLNLTFYWHLNAPCDTSIHHDAFSPVQDIWMWHQTPRKTSNSSEHHGLKWDWYSNLNSTLRLDMENLQSGSSWGTSWTTSKAALTFHLLEFHPSLYISYKPIVKKGYGWGQGMLWVCKWVSVLGECIMNVYAYVKIIINSC